jgi:hypothetical protein
MYTRFFFFFFFFDTVGRWSRRGRDAIALARVPQELIEFESKRTRLIVSLRQSPRRLREGRAQRLELAAQEVALGVRRVARLEGHLALGGGAGGHLAESGARGFRGVEHLTQIVSVIRRVAAARRGRRERPRPRVAVRVVREGPGGRGGDAHAGTPKRKRVRE